MASTTKPIASISLDLDDKWTYMKTRGDPAWSSHPTYLNAIVPRVLSFLERHDLQITFFIVGQDAALEDRRPAIRSIADAGHEIGNHSFHHEPWLHRYTKQQLEEEIASAEHWIRSATGKQPVGFRGPGFSVTDNVIDTLIERGYAYDGSTLPTFIGPLARMYYFLSVSLDSKQRQERSLLFGSVRDGFRKIKTHVWETKQGTLTEIPVTTIPFIRAPFHLSYLLFLSRYSPLLANAYLEVATTLCRITGVRPSFLLHSLDFAAPEDAPELAFFPGMQLSLEHKMQVADSAIRILKRSFDLQPMGRYAETWAQRRKRSAAGTRALPTR